MDISRLSQQFRRSRRRSITIMFLTGFIFTLLKLYPFLTQTYQIKHSDNSYLPFQRIRQLQTLEMTGQWFSDQLDSSFKHKNGTFAFDIIQLRQQKSGARVVLKLIDGQYLDDNQLTLTATLSENSIIYRDNQKHKDQTITKQISLELRNITMTVVEGNFYVDSRPKYCRFQLNISQIIKKNVDYIKLDGGSKDCKFEFTSLSVLGSLKDTRQIVYYTMMSTLIVFINFAWAVQTLKNLYGGTANSQISVYAIIVCAYQDAYITMMNFYFTSRLESVHTLLLIPSILNFMLFALFETKLIQLLYKEHTPSENILKFHLSFYIGLMVFIQLAFRFIGFQLFLMIANVQFILQIIWTIQKDSASELKKLYYMGFLMGRLAIPLYFRGYTDNFLNLQVNTPTYFIGFVGIQILVMLSQQLFGPRWFIPKRYLPKKFDYFVDVDDTKDFEEDCAICMVPLLETSSTQDSHLKFYQRKSNKLMLTPCSHKFHVNCLTRWLKIKQNCPTCRAKLPATS